MRIGVDVMGSDRSPQELFKAALQAVKKLDPSTSLIVFATPDLIPSFSAQIQCRDDSEKQNPIKFCLSSEFIEMHDDPISSARMKKNSSIVLGLKLLKKKSIDAFVSSGNTGALIAASRLTLSPLPGIRRPALLALLPTQSGKVAIIDVGGNVSSKTQFLVQFAALGAAFMQSVENLPTPRIGLLNIGAESKKGSDSLQETYKVLSSIKAENRRFVGNIEGRDVFNGAVDVLVTDGFTGNVLLKTTEGVALFFLDYLRKCHPDAVSLFKDLQQQFNYAEYPGAVVLGVDGLVIKCHGDAAINSMLHSILSAEFYVKKDLIKEIRNKLISK
ncbi:Phosphate acyltransferase [Chlamydiales bacterium STE3]|nr:Phosphate acyltransferase [Chlamydiales bacterium STE3]